MQLFLQGLILLTPFLALYAIQQLIIIPRVRKELHTINARRAERVREALAAENQQTWSEPAVAPNHPFAGWVDLRSDGTVRIGGETFTPSQTFQVTARDDHRIPRATAVCDGSGHILISSLGQTFIARFQGGQWLVQQTGALPP